MSDRNCPKISCLHSRVRPVGTYAAELNDGRNHELQNGRGSPFARLLLLVLRYLCCEIQLALPQGSHRNRPEVDICLPLIHLRKRIKLRREERRGGYSMHLSGVSH